MGRHPARLAAFVQVRAADIDQQPLLWMGLQPVGQSLCLHAFARLAAGRVRRGLVGQQLPAQCQRVADRRSEHRVAGIDATAGAHPPIGGAGDHVIGKGLRGQRAHALCMQEVDQLLQEGTMAAAVMALVEHHHAAVAHCLVEHRQGIAPTRVRFECRQRPALAATQCLVAGHRGQLRQQLFLPG
jgi:hypothetical protein